MDFKLTHIGETDSTNRWLRENGNGDDAVVVADYQSAGRGCGKNTWESEREKNLLFSVLWHPVEFPASRQFQISQAVSLALCDVLGAYIDDVEVKWPNDIYHHDRKLAGMLIENRLNGAFLKDCIIGIGLNVNQQCFVSDAPNPVSLCQILGHEVDRKTLFNDILNSIWKELRQLSTCDPALLKERYTARLYRRTGSHRFRDTATGKLFTGAIADIEADGHLVIMSDEEGHGRKLRFSFKEVEFL